MVDGTTPTGKRRRVRKPEPAPTTPDPIEIAMEAEASGLAPQGVARRVLLKQEALIGWQIRGERAGVVVKLLTAAAGLFVAAVLGLTAWDAHRARGLVFEPFSVSPSLASQGLTGRVVAARMLDELRRLQADTSLPDQREQAEDQWSNQTRVEIPNTGVSLCELQALLKAWLGQEKHVTAELSGGAASLTLTVRTGNAPGERFTGTAAEIDALIAKGAESVYAEARPLQFAQYLLQHDRHPEAFTIFERISLQGTRVERAGAMALWGANLKEPREGLVKLRQAAALDPDLPLAWTVIAVREEALFHSEAALTAARRALVLWTGPRNRDYTPAVASGGRYAMEGMISSLLGNQLGRARAAELGAAPDPDITLSSCQQCSAAGMRNAAYAYAAAGDGDGARRMLALARATSPEPQLEPGFNFTADLILKRATEDWPAVADVFDDPTGRNRAYLGLGIWASSFHALALAQAGRAAEATAIIEATPPGCYMCVVDRGVVASLGGGWRAADAAFARAAAMGPSLPHAAFERGRSLLRRGDLRGAEREFARADRLSPSFGSPQMAWGEARLSQGDAKGAIAHFAKAQPHLPRMGHLHLKWGEALAKLGKSTEARAKWRAAVTMNMSTADRERAQVLLRSETS